MTYEEVVALQNKLQRLKELYAQRDRLKAVLHRVSITKQSQENLYGAFELHDDSTGYLSQVREAIGIPRGVIQQALIVKMLQTEREIRQLGGEV